MKRLIPLVCMAFLIGTATAWAQPTQEVYVSTGEHGETRFSDVAEPGAERIEVIPAEPPEGAEQELERRIEQTLRVAEALEASRLAREKARAEARAQAAAQAPPAPQVIYQDRNVGSPYLWRSPYDHRFPRHPRFRDHDRFDKWPHRREHRRDREPRERTFSRKFPYEPD